MQVISRRTIGVGLLLLALGVTDAEAETKKREKKRRARGLSGGIPANRRDAKPGESCSCSSKRVCVGPRGGRYCVTSGGKKRYP